MDKEEYLKLKYAEVHDAPIAGKPSKRAVPQKIRHKHTWKRCLLRVPGYLDKTKHNYALATYCEECGKIGDIDRKDKFYKKLVREQGTVVFGFVPEQYVEEALGLYEVFDIDDIITDKYVSFARSV